MISAYRKDVDLKRWRTYLDWALLLLILFFAFSSIILVPTLLTTQGPEKVPYALHSILNANYSIDPLGLMYFQVKSDIIAQVIGDENRSLPGDGAGNVVPPGLPSAGTAQPFSTPTPTYGAINPSATSSTHLTPGITEPSTPGVEKTQQVTGTPGSNSKTAAPTGSVATRRPTATTDPRRTSVPPTLTSTNRSPGSTSIAPTRTTIPTTQSPTSTTPPPTSTPTERPTSTPPPPTRTPTPTDEPTNTPRPTRPPDPYPPPPPEATPYP